MKRPRASRDDWETLESEMSVANEYARRIAEQTADPEMASAASIISELVELAQIKARGR